MRIISKCNVEQEYKKHPSIKQEEIQKIMDWIQSQPHLPAKYISELDVILAYHACELHSEMTKQVIDLQYTLRALCSFYQSKEFDKPLETAFRTWVMTMLKKHDVDGNKVIYCQLLDPNPKNFVYVDSARIFQMVIDLWQHEEGTAPGLVVVINLDGLTAGHLVRIDHMVAFQFVSFLQEALFVRLKSIHLLNAPVFMDVLLNMFKPAMNKDLINKLFIHQRGSTKVYETVMMDAFPKDLGGSCGTLLELRDEVWNKVQQNREFFEINSKKVVKENKRVGKQKSLNTFFGGIEGSFKTLNID